MPVLDQEAVALLFGQARSHNGWLDRPVAEEQLRALYDMMKLGPTSMNCQPARIVFATSAEAKQKLVEAVVPGNVEKTRTAPVVAVVGYDLDFVERLPRLFPHNPKAPGVFEGKADLIQATAFRNGSLQGAYLMIAARALGLDCGPMSGFDPARVERDFFPDGTVKVNFLCNIGYGDPAKLFARSPRMDFDEACRIV